MQIQSKSLGIPGLRGGFFSEPGCLASSRQVPTGHGQSSDKLVGRASIYKYETKGYIGHSALAYCLRHFTAMISLAWPTLYCDLRCQ